MGGNSTNSTGMLDGTWRRGPRLPTPPWGSWSAELQQQQDPSWSSCLRHWCCCSEGSAVLRAGAQGCFSPEDKKGPGRDSHWHSSGATTGAVKLPVLGWEGERGQERLPTQMQGMAEWPSWTVASWHPVWAANASWVPWARCCTVPRPRAGAKGRSVTAPGTWGQVCVSRQAHPLSALAESLSGLNGNTCLASSLLCMAHRGADTVNRGGGSSLAAFLGGPHPLCRSFHPTTAWLLHNSPSPSPSMAAPSSRAVPGHDRGIQGAQGLPKPQRPGPAL